MNSRQAKAFQKEFIELLLKHEATTYIFFSLIEEENDIQGIFFGNAQGPQLAAVSAQSVVQNLIAVLASQNGLGPHAAAGALKGMVDGALDDILEDMYSPQPNPGPLPRPEA